ncbi:MAG: PfkB family carbohydrate kinase [Casimicrobiaceae bacterium]
MIRQTSAPGNGLGTALPSAERSTWNTASGGRPQVSRGTPRAKGRAFTIPGEPFADFPAPVPRILCLGMSALDAIYRVPAIPARPTKILATDFAESGGGMAANASVAVARLGGQPHYWGRVGDDELGTRILSQLTADGVDVSGVRRIPGCVSPSAAILVAHDGERLVCAYNDPRLNSDASWLPLGQVPTFDAVLADVRWPEGSAAVLDAARAARRIAVLDGDVGPPEVIVDLAARATHVMFSEPGLALVAGAGAPGAALAKFAATHAGVVGVTLGPDGFLWRQTGAERRVPGYPINAVDTLAAGDVWHGAFTLALAEGADVEVAARFANAAAAIKCARFGGRDGAPTRPEVERLLASVNK